MEPRIESVLVATDGSEPARRAASHGVALAGAVGADVHALAVVDGATSDLARRFTDEATVGALEEAAESAVVDVAELAGSHPAPVDVTTAVRTGRPHEVIADYAAEAGLDAIVAGTEGRSGIDRVLLGSVAENLLRSAGAPVLVVPPGAPDLEARWATNEGADDPPGGSDGGGAAAGRPPPYEQLLLPTDGSDGADRALDWAVWLAAVLEVPLHALFAADATPFPTTVRSRQLLDALSESGRDAIERVRERGGDAGVEVEGAVGSGAPGPTIVEFCEDEVIDLVVMGTHGRSGIERALLGSVTEHVVRHGDVPVFCVPPGAT